MINYLNEIYNNITNHLGITVICIQAITTIPYSMAFWFNRKRNVLKWVAISCCFFALGYLLASAYLGFVIAVGTIIATTVGMVFEKRKKQTKWSVRLIPFIIMAVITTIVGRQLEHNVIMLLIILVAGLPSYFSYIVFREYQKNMHIVLILSQVAYVAYEIINTLYLFAILDFVTCVIIIWHMRFLSIDKLEIKAVKQ